MKIAVISDIHGNMEAVEAVMEDISKRNCEKIFILGDFAMAGPEPSDTINYFMNKSEDKNITMIQGNTDLMIAKYSDEIYNQIKEKAPIMAEALKNDVETINPVQKQFLRNLPIQKEITIDNTTFLLVHGSPRKNNEDILPETPLKEVEEMLKNVDASTVLCGHTHIPCGFQTSTKKTVVNVGSIGRPFFVRPDNNGIPESCYLIIEIENNTCSFEHIFVDYNREQAAEKLSKRSFKGADKLAQMLINPKNRHF